MTYDASLLGYFYHASVVVKCVMMLLIGASIFSWAYILQRAVYLKEVDQSTENFATSFWNGEDLTKHHRQDSKDAAGLEAIFQAGYGEFSRFSKNSNANLDIVIENTKRAMRVAQSREQDKMETNLPFLAIVGSTSTYVGLFGTVWGIMQAFRALATVQQATISMVAPGIAEALIATALGLFAAIPAGIAYNRYLTDINRLMNRFEAFQEEFVNLLIRQSHAAKLPAGQI